MYAVAPSKHKTYLIKSSLNILTLRVNISSYSHIPQMESFKVRVLHQKSSIFPKYIDILLEVPGTEIAEIEGATFNHIYSLNVLPPGVGLHVSLYHGSQITANIYVYID